MQRSKVRGLLSQPFAGGEKPEGLDRGVMKKGYLYGKKILSHENPTRKLQRFAIDYHMDEKRKLFLPEEYTKLCQGCGKYKLNPTEYWGETFCGDCVTKWKQGIK
jgi:hypothetical protein